MKVQESEGSANEGQMTVVHGAGFTRGVALRQALEINALLLVLGRTQENAPDHR